MRSVVCFVIATLAASITGTAAGAEVVCDGGTARFALNQYVQAFNGGEYPRLQHLFAHEPDFGWYAVAPPHGRTNQRSQDRSSLTTYFRSRHLKREVLRVVQFNFASTQKRPSGVVIAHFNGQLTRKATDLSRERRGFKATIQCGSSTQFIVLSIGNRN